MNRFLLLAVMAFTLQITSCGCTYVEPGHVGVYVDRNKGVVNDTPVGPGYQSYMPVGAHIVEYPVFMQTVVYCKSPHEGSDKNEEIDVTTMESQSIAFDVSLSFELDGAKVPKLYTRFRSDIHSITHNYVRQTIREGMQEVVGNMHILDVLGSQKGQIKDKVTEKLVKELSQYGFLIKQFTINATRPPDSIVKAIEAKNVMEQEGLQAQNAMKKKEYEGQQMVITAEAEGRSITAKAEAQAKANKLIAESLSPTLVNYMAVQKWDGHLPTSTGGAVPFLNLGKTETPAGK